MSSTPKRPAPTSASPATGTASEPVDPRHVGDAPDNDGPPISPLNPGSMHRAEDDAAAFATSPEFHERPLSAEHTAPAATATPPSASRPAKPRA
jgi:hypothetical protein